MDQMLDLESLKAETLRSVMRDLGLKNLAKREDMVDFLEGKQLGRQSGNARQEEQSIQPKSRTGRGTATKNTTGLSKKSISTPVPASAAAARSNRKRKADKDAEEEESNEEEEPASSGPARRTRARRQEDDDQDDVQMLDESISASPRRGRSRPARDSVAAAPSVTKPRTRTRDVSPIVVDDQSISTGRRGRPATRKDAASAPAPSRSTRSGKAQSQGPSTAKRGRGRPPKNGSLKNKQDEEESEEEAVEEEDEESASVPTTRGRLRNKGKDSAAQSPEPAVEEPTSRTTRSRVSAPAPRTSSPAKTKRTAAPSSSVPASASRAPHSTRSRTGSSPAKKARYLTAPLVKRTYLRKDTLGRRTSGRTATAASTAPKLRSSTSRAAMKNSSAAVAKAKAKPGPKPKSKLKPKPTPRSRTVAGKGKGKAAAPVANSSESESGSEEETGGRQGRNGSLFEGVVLTRRKAVGKRATNDVDAEGEADHDMDADGDVDMDHVNGAGADHDEVQASAQMQAHGHAQSPPVNSDAASGAEENEDQSIPQPDHSGPVPRAEASSATQDVDVDMEKENEDPTTIPNQQGLGPQETEDEEEEEEGPAGPDTEPDFEMPSNIDIHVVSMTEVMVDETPNHHPVGVEQDEEAAADGGSKNDDGAGNSLDLTAAMALASSIAPPSANADRDEALSPSSSPAEHELPPATASGPNSEAGNSLFDSLGDRIGIPEQPDALVHFDGLGNATFVDSGLQVQIDVIPTAVASGSENFIAVPPPDPLTEQAVNSLPDAEPDTVHPGTNITALANYGSETTSAEGVLADESQLVQNSSRAASPGPNFAPSITFVPLSQGEAPSSSMLVDYQTNSSYTPTPAFSTPTPAAFDASAIDSLHLMRSGGQGREAAAELEQYEDYQDFDQERENLSVGPEERHDGPGPSAREVPYQQEEATDHLAFMTTPFEGSHMHWAAPAPRAAGGTDGQT